MSSIREICGFLHLLQKLTDVEEFVESFTNIVQRRPLLFPIAEWAIMITIIFFVGYIILAFIARRPSEEYVPFIFVVSVTFPVAVFVLGSVVMIM